MLDFTSALYLGLEHASRNLPEWEHLTLGKPAALKTAPEVNQAERQLAALIGCERALLATSTLHLFWDLFTVLARRNVNIFLDSGSYPIVRWGVERAACSGTPVRLFRQHDPDDLKSVLEKADYKPPVIVADGYCPSCGKPAPIADYLALAGAYNGFVVIDDSQALGVFGQPQMWVPYGIGGGGSMRRAGISSGRLLIGSSLAKAFGVPVAVMAGSGAMVDEFERQSVTRVHCSPPSAAMVSAAVHAMKINRACGDELRMKLARRVARFRRGLAKLRLIAIPGLFPVQPLRLPHLGVETIYEDLKNAGVESVLHRGADDQKARISFIVTVRHSLRDIDRALIHLAESITRRCRKSWKGVKDNELLPF